MMLRTKTKISIILPVHNATKTIMPCLDAILAQINDLPHAQIIVVDNGKNGNLKQKLAHLSVIVLEKTAMSSAAYARNEGAKYQFADILVFVDSDVVLEKNCIQRLIEPIINQDCHATIGNYSTNVEQLNFAQKYKQLYIHNVYKRQKKVLKNYFWTAISAIDANIFHSVGGFDTSFPGASGEDHELGIRLTAKDYVVHRIDKAFGLHLHEYTIPKIIANDLKKGIGVLKNAFDKKVALTDHSHVSKLDILAVFGACLAPLLVIISIVLNSIVLVGMAIAVLVLWAFCKSPLLQLFRQSQGLVFMFRTLPLMLVLEWVRAICVIYGIVGKVLYSIRPTNAEKEIVTKPFPQIQEQKVLTKSE